MPFVKSLFGTLTTADFTLKEGSVGFTENPGAYRDMEARGLAKVFKTQEEADAFKFRSSHELFQESYLSLNPPEDKDGNPIQVPPATLDFANSQPVIIDGIPANYIKVIPAPAPAPAEPKTSPSAKKTEVIPPPAATA
jgi:hypothetical protein